ncbi:MAG: DNA polymerase IV [Clostridiales bacterium]|nr:DNA polymerase IV [Clostridiales bacterium]
MRKVIFLVDMNAFFISCEMTRDPSLAGKPAAVAGDPNRRTGIILAANYEARDCGVKTTMLLHQALKLCPDMRLVPPDHDFYEKKSNEVMELLTEFTPVVEQNSIDEAWLDMTGTEGLFGSPREAAGLIMARIRDELGLKCSIGIAGNRFLSKMASEMKKPMGITELWEEDLPLKLWPLPAQAMYGIGKQSAALLSKIGVNTIGDIAASNIDFLTKYLGKMGFEIYMHANGRDDSEVSVHYGSEMKSIGHSTTLSEDVSDLKTAGIVLMDLADDIGMTARRNGKKGRTVHITIKYSDFRVITRQTTIPATYLTKDIIAAGLELLSANWDVKKPVRLLGISLSGFDEAGAMSQVSMFDMSTLNCKPKYMSEKEEKLEKAMDAIRAKHGTAKLNRAVLMKNSSEKRIEPPTKKDP